MNGDIGVIGSALNIPIVFGQNNLEKMRLSGGKLGIGTGSTVSAFLHVKGTTEQGRFGYDASNYFSITVGSNGAVTLDAVGSGAGFTFSDTISASNLSGTNTGDQTITLTGDVTGTGTGSFAATIANSAVTLAKMANMATASLIYRKTAGSGAPEVNTLATLKTDLGFPIDLSGTDIAGHLAGKRFLGKVEAIHKNLRGI